MRDPTEIVIVSALRSPVGKLNGALASFSAADLSVFLIKEILKKCNLNPAKISEVIIGQVLTAGQGQNPSRIASVKSGIPYETPAYLVNMVCGSGLKSISLAYNSLKLDNDGIIVAGGQESMSKAPYSADIRNGVKLGDTTFNDIIIKDGLTDPFNNIHMGVTENVAKKYHISRVMQDEFALRSQLKYQLAHNNKYFDDEMLTIEIPSRKGAIKISQDEHPKINCTIEELNKLKPVFIKSEEGGTVTAGNASGINDGAAIVLLMSLNKAIESNLRPLVRIVACAEYGVDPSIMGIAPVGAVKKAVEKAKWKLDEIDLFELNEAFASQSIAVIQELGISPEKVNVNGGALALGHPIGASGARIMVTLIHSLNRLQKIEPTKPLKGLAALCIGGGMGIAVCIETLPDVCI
ncbi:acetyl-CoA acetyltransferase, cytosolic-like isoform X2 [Gordionus sp. m RMFG-2023]|uniref:acetyl-CoA acetyltransferase, cytosolic-like isoform X2 n=1 Tax=Gordionus sp. m RMFG-2023 TaxID=3053472 RepID=UPI0031FD4953